MNDLIVVAGPASVELGHKVASFLKAKVVDMEFKRFPDGESYIRFADSVKDQDVVIVQTTSPPQDENLIQLLLIADNAEEMGAKSITAVAPYLAYARQDSVFRPGEALSVRTIVNLLKTCGVKRIITVNSHNPTVLKKNARSRGRPFCNQPLSSAFQGERVQKCILSFDG